MKKLKSMLLLMFFVLACFALVACGEPGEKGDPGADGANGVGIVSIEKTSTSGNIDIYTIVYTNNTTSIFTVTNGEDGEDGVSVTNATIDSQGNLILSLSEGQSVSVGKVVGTDGKSIEGVNLSADGMLSVTYGGNTYQLGNVKGSDGKSAYEIYKQYNPSYTGSEEQWIDDLVNGRLGTQQIQVTFDSDGGSAVEGQTLNPCSKIAIPATPTKEGYDFDGWYVDGEKWSFIGHVATENMTLTAKWVPNVVDVIFNYNDGSDNSYKVSTRWSGAVGLPTLRRESYDFLGWQVNGTGEYITGNYIIPMGGATLVAVWSKASNPADEYEYYESKYGITDSQIVSITLADLELMSRTPGKYLVYVDLENATPTSATASRFNEVNRLAKKWGVKVHHFNPDLAGGYGLNNTSLVNVNLHKAETDGKNNQIDDCFDLYAEILDGLVETSSGYANGVLYALIGAENTYEIDGSSAIKTIHHSVAYSGVYGSVNLEQNVIIPFCTLKTGAEVGSTNPTDYVVDIDTFNVFADSRFHMAEDAYLDEKQDVFVTLANYGQFVHLLENCDGNFVVLFGRFGCPNTQAITKYVDQLAKEYGVQKVYLFDNYLGGCIRPEKATVSNGEIVVNKFGSYINTFLQTRSANTHSANHYTENSVQCLYAQFMTEYMQDYVEKYNNASSDMQIVSNGQIEYYARICNPTLLLFDGRGNGSAKCVDSFGAEYIWDRDDGSGTSNPNSDAYAYTQSGIKGVLDQVIYSSKYQQDIFAYNPETEDKPANQNVSVKFLNTGSPVNTQIVKVGSKVTKPADPVRTGSGYEFVGWYVGDEEWSFENDVVTEDIVIEAVWVRV